MICKQTIWRCQSLGLDDGLTIFGKHIIVKVVQLNAVHKRIRLGIVERHKDAYWRHQRQRLVADATPQSDVFVLERRRNLRRQQRASGRGIVVNVHLATWRSARVRRVLSENLLWSWRTKDQR